MFETNGDLKCFGLGPDNTLFSFGIFTVVLAIASFYLFCVIDLIFGNSKTPTGSRYKHDFNNVSNNAIPQSSLHQSHSASSHSPHISNLSVIDPLRHGGGKYY